MTSPAWMQQAACADLDPELFHPHRGDNIGFRNALAVCAGCLVRSECLAYAFTFPVTEVLGVWGGTTERQRTQKRRYALRRAA